MPAVTYLKGGGGDSKGGQQSLFAAWQTGPCAPDREDGADADGDVGMESKNGAASASCLACAVLLSDGSLSVRASD